LVRHGKHHSVKAILWNVQGISSVEMAIVLPVLLLLVFGMLQFGLGWRLSQVITNGAREGARFGVVVADPPITDTAVQNRVVSYLNNSGVPANTGMVAVGYSSGSFGTCLSGCEVSVTVTVPTTNLVPALFPLFPNPISAQAVMRHE
jgi:Flp pilus assembly protein TadG